MNRANSLCWTCLPFCCFLVSDRLSCYCALNIQCTYLAAFYNFPLDLCIMSHLNTCMSVFYRMGRDMAYDCWSCDLLCAASSSDLYRINLEKVFNWNLPCNLHLSMLNENYHFLAWFSPSAFLVGNHFFCSFYVNPYIYIYFRCGN